MNDLKPSVVTLNETNVHGNKKLEIKGYFTYAKNRNGRHMGGVSTSVPINDLKDTISTKYSSEGR